MRALGVVLLLGMFGCACGSTDGSAGDVRGGGESSPVGAWTLEGGHVVWAAGDLCDNGVDPVGCDEVAALIAGDPEADALLAIGDLQYDVGMLAEFQTWWHAQMGVLNPITWPVPGNHEYRTPGAAGFLDYWRPIRGSNATYYRTTLGNWTVVAADSNCSKVGGCGSASRQGRFIKAALQEAPTCELVYAHHPVFSDSEHGDSAAGKRLYQLAYNGRGDLYLGAHDHNYQRFAPKRPDGTLDAGNGVRSFVIGTGGATLYGWSASPQRSEFRQNTQIGALRLVLDNGGYTGEFIAVDGTVVDTVSGSCHA